MKVKKILKTIYVVGIFGLLIAIGIKTFVGKSNSPAKEEKVKFKPSSYTSFCNEFDKYFSANFGFRSRFISMNNIVKYNVFKQSGEDNVIAGRDGWLFYNSALHDYIGEDVLSDEEIIKIADYVEAISEKCEKAGKKFVFVIAPNKMEIYGEYMPYYYVENCPDGNYEKLIKELSSRKVAYTDLKKLFKEDNTYSGVELYHKLDSHWNNLGASLAYMEIMDKAGINATDYRDIPYSEALDFNGDLYDMLFPEGRKKDIQYYFENTENFDYTSRFMGVDDLIITTENADKTGSALLYRDSFGNALYKFFSDDFKNVTVSRAVPYDMSSVGDYDVIVVEIVERNIKNLLEYSEQ